MHGRCGIRDALFGLLAGLGVSGAHATTTVWDFAASLDGRPIGQHRFELEETEDGRSQLRSAARFDVKLLGLSVYRYQHENLERWQGDCLQEMQARTDDDGRETRVQARAADGSYERRVQGPEPPPPQTLPACVSSFAYWRPDLVKREALLDPGSGRWSTVRFSALPARTLEVQGRPQSVQGWRIEGLPQPIDVWYADRRWVGLDAKVGGGRTLSYRLR